MKVLIGVNNLEGVHSFAYSSHCQFWATTRKQFPEADFLMYAPYRMSIDSMRNDAARIALEQECDYLMFIDDDVLIPPDTFKMLVEANKDIIAGFTFIRGYPFHPMFFKERETFSDVDGRVRRHLSYHDEWQEDVQTDGLVETGAVGFSCVLINMDVVKALHPPYFVTGPGHTEDVYFCLRAKSELEPSPSIFVHTLVKTGHMLMPDIVSLDNVDKLRLFYAPEEEQVGLGRMKSHLESVLQRMAPDVEV